jgi:chitinase
MTKWLAAIFLLVFQAGSAQTLIGYYSGTARDMSRYPIEKLTHIIYAFCSLKGDRLWASRGDSAAIRRLVKLKERNPTLKILLSLGGWGGCATCSLIFSTAEGRENFVKSVAELSESLHTDGVDIDWEFPALAAYPGHRYSSADRNNLTALLEALRRELKPTWEVSLTSAGFSPYLEQSIDWKGVTPFVTRVNLMTFDLIGSKSPITGHNAALYSTLTQRSSAERAVNYLDSLGVPLSKLVIGAAFYAREFDGVQESNHGLYQPGKFTRFVSLGQLKTEYDEKAGFREYWDSVAEASYRYNPGRHIFLSYDDARSVGAKALFARKRGLSGVMFWALQMEPAPALGSGSLVEAIYRNLKE